MGEHRLFHLFGPAYIRVAYRRHEVQQGIYQIILPCFHIGAPALIFFYYTFQLQVGE